MNKQIVNLTGEVYYWMFLEKYILTLYSAETFLTKF